jgi:hypothetical protein
MPIRIEWKNGAPVAECDTVAEAIEMMRGASSSHSGTNGSNGKNAQPTRPASPIQQKPLTFGKESAGYTAYLKEQTGNVRQWLKALYGIGGEIKAEDLAVASGINALAFGGLIGAISKTSKKANVPIDLIFTSEQRFDGPRRERWYSPGEILKEHGGEAFNG